MRDDLKPYKMYYVAKCVARVKSAALHECKAHCFCLDTEKHTQMLVSFVNVFRSDSESV